MIELGKCILGIEVRMSIESENESEYKLYHIDKDAPKTHRQHELTKKNALKDEGVRDSERHDRHRVEKSEDEPGAKKKCRQCEGATSMTDNGWAGYFEDKGE